MSDRELLELAAKAAGYKVNARRQAERDAIGSGAVGLWIDGVSTGWNPLLDGGHALVLAVDLGLVVFAPINHSNFASACEDGGPIWAQEPVGGTDKVGATCRAIVRAAAEIGREMP